MTITPSSVSVASGGSTSVNVAVRNLNESAYLQFGLGNANAFSASWNGTSGGANVLKMDEAHLEKVLTAAVACAREAVRRSGKEAFVALDIGPTGKLLKPYGTMDFEEAVKVFAKTVRIGARLDVDLVTIETMTDLAETKAAVLAVA